MSHRDDPPRRPPYAWDAEQPVRITALRPLVRAGNPHFGPFPRSERTYPVGEFWDKFTGRWVRCTMREYLRSIGWTR